LIFSLSKKARFKLDEFLDAIEAPKKGSMVIDDTVGKLLRVTVVHEEFNGRIIAKPQIMLTKSSTATPEIKHSTSGTGASLAGSAKPGKSPF
jgi:hypothetical protein